MIFCWVLHKQSITGENLSNLDLTRCAGGAVSLICRRGELVRRLRKDIDAGIRHEDVLARSLKRLPLYAAPDTIKIDVSDLSVEQTAEVIATGQRSRAWTKERACPRCERVLLHKMLQENCPTRKKAPPEPEFPARAGLSLQMAALCIIHSYAQNIRKCLRQKYL